MGRIVTTILTGGICQGKIDIGKQRATLSGCQFKPMTNQEPENQISQRKRSMEESFNEMNAIAYGVEARYDLLIGYSGIVTQETIDIARHLGIPEREIQSWAAARARHNSERNKAIKRLH